MVLLPAPLGPTRAIISPGCDGEADVVERGLADAVAEGDVAELDLALHAGQLRAGASFSGMWGWVSRTAKIFSMAVTPFWMTALASTTRTIGV